jgi:hypothetical protein
MHSSATTCLVLALSSILLVGCSSTIYVREDEPLDNDKVFNIEQVNARVGAVPASLMCADGTMYETDSLLVRPDTTFFKEAASKLHWMVPTRSVLKIEYQDYGRGALTGTLTGALAAFGAGAGILAFGPHSNPIRIGAGVVILLGMPFAALIGGIVGSVAGSTQVLQFTPARGAESGRSATPLSAAQPKPLQVDSTGR